MKEMEIAIIEILWQTNAKNFPFFIFLLHEAFIQRLEMSIFQALFSILN